MVERGVAGADLADAFTQKDVQAALGVAQSTASTVLADLQRLGYVREGDRQAEGAAGGVAATSASTPSTTAEGSGGSKGGRPATAYAFTGATRLVSGTPPSASTLRSPTSARTPRPVTLPLAAA